VGELRYSGEDGAAAEECRRMASRGGAGELLHGGAAELRQGELRLARLSSGEF
jgi:hypothetical protein